MSTFTVIMAYQYNPESRYCQTGWATPHQCGITWRKGTHIVPNIIKPGILLTYEHIL
jgi:hypothetical protein